MSENKPDKDSNSGVEIHDSNQRADLMGELFANLGVESDALKHLFDTSTLPKKIRKRAEQELANQADDEIARPEPKPVAYCMNEEGVRQKRPLLVRGIVV